MQPSNLDTIPFLGQSSNVLDIYYGQNRHHGKLVPNFLVYVQQGEKCKCDGKKTPRVPSILSKSKPLHQPLANRPHPSPFAVNVHRNGHEHEKQLNTTNGKKHGSGAISLEPIHNKQRENQAVENVC